MMAFRLRSVGFTSACLIFGLAAVVSPQAVADENDGNADGSRIAISGSPPRRAHVPLAGKGWMLQYVNAPGQSPDPESWQESKSRGGPLNMPEKVNLGRLNPDNPDADRWGLWFRRETGIPAEWTQGRLVLMIGRAMYGGAVTVNGRKAGEIPPFGGELDITGLAEPGRTVEIMIYCGRLGKGLDTLDAVARSAADYFRQRDPSGGWLAGPTGLFGLPEEFRIEYRPSDVYVSEVWYRTFVRGGVRIEPMVRVWSDSARENLSYRIRIYEPDSESPVLEKIYPVDRVPAGESMRHLALPADHLELWDIHTPNLYFGQVEILDQAGNVLDRSNPDRFGIREFWTQGRYFYLNNRLVTPVPSFTGYADSLEELMETGVNMVQRGFPIWFQYFNEDFRELAAQCDERGLLLIAGGMTHHELNLTTPEVMNDYLLWAAEYYRRHANHPSIVMYGLGINAPGNFNNFSPTRLGTTRDIIWTHVGATRTYQIGRQMDPTRLFYFHGGASGGDMSSGNFYPNHHPTQEVEDWMRQWSREGDRPFLTVEGLLSTFNVDYQKSREGYVTEYIARKYGDIAYEQECDAYRKHVAYEYPRSDNVWTIDVSQHPLIDTKRATTLLRAGRAWRFLRIPFAHWSGAPGVPGYRDGFPKFLQASLDLRQPVMVWIGGPADDFSLKDHNFYGGSEVEKTILGIYDRHGVSTWAMDWDLKDRDSGSVLASDRITLNVSPSTRLKEPFRFRLPDVTQPTLLDLSLHVRDVNSGETVGRDVFEISAYPRPAMAEKPAAPPFSVFDPEGDTRAWLNGMGVATRPWTPGSAEPGDVLVIGRRALRGLRNLPYTVTDVEAGLRIAVFEQHCRELGNIGFRHEDRSPRQVFVRQHEHPLASGLHAGALRDWRGHATLISPGPEGDRVAVSTRSFRAGNRGSVASAIIETPHFGPFETILDCEFDLSYTPLMRWRQGRGEMIFCQLDLVDRIGREPGAGRVARNLIEYLQTPLEGQVNRTAVCLDEETIAWVEGFGFAAVPAPDRRRFPRRDGLDQDKHVLVITAPQVDMLAAKRAEIAAFLEDGGEMLVFYADETLLADELFGGRIRAETVRLNTNLIETRDHPLLRGVGPQNLHWRGAMDFVRLTSDDADFESLLEGLAGELSYGDGRIVFFQVDPVRMADIRAAIEEDPKLRELDPDSGEPKVKPLSDARLQLHRKRSRWHAHRLNSLILGNLGLRSSDDLADRLFEVKPAMTQMPVNEWVILGPFPPLEENPDTNPIKRRKDELIEIASNREMTYEFRNRKGGTTRWFAPNDMMHGLGQDGMNDLSRIYGVDVGQVAVAVTHIWSTRERQAQIGVGADWWLHVHVNGEQVFETTSSPWTFGINFDRKVNVNLKPGWNEVVCYLASGSNSHILWFEIDNPGDVRVAQTLRPPAHPPENLPDEADLVPDDIDPGFQLYAEPMTGRADPYSYHPW